MYFNQVQRHNIILTSLLLLIYNKYNSKYIIFHHDIKYL